MIKKNMPTNIGTKKSISANILAKLIDREPKRPKFGQVKVKDSSSLLGKGHAQDAKLLYVSRKSKAHVAARRLLKKYYDIPAAIFLRRYGNVSDVEFAAQKRIGVLLHSLGWTMSPRQSAVFARELHVFYNRARVRASAKMGPLRSKIGAYGLKVLQIAQTYKHHMSKSFLSAVASEKWEDFIDDEGMIQSLKNNRPIFRVAFRLNRVRLVKVSSMLKNIIVTRV